MGIKMLKILLVDDEVSERNGIKFLIERYQFPLLVSEAPNGKKALEYIKTHPIDILFTDIKMPYMDGLELAEETHAYNSAIKIIIFSAYGEFEYARKALKANAVNYILKPIEIEEFKTVMENAIRLCEEEKSKNDQKQNLLEADKKMLLYRLLTGMKMQGELTDQLEQYNISLLNKYTVLMNIETRNSFFAEKEELFLNLVKMYAPCDCEYVNFYPNASYLILYSRNKMGKEDLERFAGNLNRDMKLLENEVSSFLIGNVFNDVEIFQKEAQELNQKREEIFECEQGVLFLSEVQKFSDFYAVEIEMIRQKAEKFIEEKDLYNTRLHISKLLEAASKYKALSTVYMHHIFYDLINKCYIKFGIYDNNLIHNRIDSLIKCSNIETLEQMIEEMFEEISRNCQAGMVDQRGIANKVIHIIQNEYSNDLSLDYIADKVNLVSSYLSYIFKKETGSNLVKYITDFRMEKAKKLLEEGNLKINQVGKCCGYENQSYFNRLFKNYYGETPKQFREKNYD